MQEKRKYLEGTLSLLKDSQKEKKKYFIYILGRKFVVYPNVFSPKYFKDSEFFAKEVPIIDGEDVLEIGSGTGIISVFTKIKGARKVVALDINPNAVKNTKENAKINKVKVDVRESDVYSALKEGEKFDTIFWNTPFAFTNKKRVSVLEKSVADPGYKATAKFIKEAKDRLKKNGRLLIGFSSTLGHINLLKSLLNKYKYRIKLIKQIKSKEVYPVKFEIFEAKLKKK